VGTLSLTRPSAYNKGVRSMSGKMRQAVGTFTFSSSYTTGGEPFDLPSVFPGVAQSVKFVRFADAGGYVFEYDDTVKKVLARRSGAGAGVMPEAPAATDLSTLGPIPWLAVTVKGPHEP
jgi:hypothetical protein